jgi:hypothetical protein
MSIGNYLTSTNAPSVITKCPDIVPWLICMFLLTLQYTINKLGPFMKGANTYVNLASTPLLELFR